MAIRHWYGVVRLDAVVKYIADALCMVLRARTERMRELIAYRVGWYEKATACCLGRTQGPSQRISTGSYTGCSEPQELGFIVQFILILIAYLMTGFAAAPKEYRGLLGSQEYQKNIPF
jgi:hypothetical protein